MSTEAFEGEFTGSKLTNAELINKRRVINGEDDGLMQVSPLKHPWAREIFKSMQRNNWVAEEVPFQKDKEQWDNMNTLKVRSFDEYQFQTDYPEMKRLTNDFGNIIGSKDITPFFVLQEKDSDFPFHIDMGFQCAINIMIKGGDTPILFRENDNIHEYNYENALLNICNIFHSVPVQKDVNRMLLKFRIKDVSYSDASKRMMEYFGE